MTQESKDKIVVYPLRMEVFTEYHRITGQIMASALRTFGTINKPEPYLFLKDVTTSNLLRTQDYPIESSYARILKQSIVLVVPNEELDHDQKLMIARLYSRGELLQRQAMLVLSNYEIQGDLHLDQELDVENVLLDRAETFIGVTNVHIIYLPNPSLKFSASTVLFNKSLVNFVCGGAPQNKF